MATDVCACMGGPRAGPFVNPTNCAKFPVDSNRTFVPNWLSFVHGIEIFVPELAFR